MPEDDQTEPTAREAYQIAQQALDEVNGLEESIEELEQDTEQLEERVTALELRYSGQQGSGAVQGSDSDD